MYTPLLVIHSWFRWLVLAALLLALYRGVTGYYQKKTFSPSDNAIRHWTATIAHLQLVIGVILYLKSPVTLYYWKSADTANANGEIGFFGWFHAALMISSVVVVTIGSALAKRKLTDADKFKTMSIWFFIAIMLIFMAIPWPFYSWASRPYLRMF